nr:sodium/glutamate symporter [uncultured Capnocytophaga sp.]
MNTIIVNPYYTLIAATLVLLLGRLLVAKIKLLQNFNIPEPVAGGLLMSFLVYLLYIVTGLSFENGLTFGEGISLNFDKGLQDSFMLFFFTSIGLSADLSRLKSGGIGLFIFLGIVALFIVIQNIVGIGLASAFGLEPIIGLVTGSITLTGGHGTAGAWGKVLEQDYHIQGATALGMASATFGLVLGGLIGGPVARRLVNKMGRKPLSEEAQKNNNDNDNDNDTEVSVFEQPEKQRLITSKSAIETMALFAACLSFSALMDSDTVKAFFPDKFTLPQFVWALFFGVFLRNILTYVFKIKMFDRAIDVFGNASLSLFLGIALLNLKLWQLLDLALPMLVILAVQTFVMSTYAYFVTYRLMGKDYDAAVLAGGHCGFGLGATPTAVANMQSITDKFGPSHKAFLIVPMVGAFFVDFVNAFILTGFVYILRLIA